MSPLRKLHQQAEAAFIAWPPIAAVDRVRAPLAAIEVVDSFGDVEAERSAIASAAAVFDRPDRATIRVSGADRLDFLNRMLTQDLRALAPFHFRRAFWLNRKGRIEADLRVLALEDHILFDLDATAAAAVVESLSSFSITEDVSIEDETDRRHRLSLFGPATPSLLTAVASHVAGAPLGDLAPGSAALVRIINHEVLIERQDSTGGPGFELLLTPAQVEPVYHQLLEAGGEHNGAGRGLRAIGWSAWSAERLEAGWPIFPIDFDSTSLPHESGALRDRVSFTKGCYLGQEIVARMESLGHPKQRLVAVCFEPAPGGKAPPPRTRLFPANSPNQDPVGHVTSSALSRHRAGAAVCFAQVRHAFTSPGAQLRTEPAAGDAVGVVQKDLCFTA